MLLSYALPYILIVFVCWLIYKFGFSKVLPILGQVVLYLFIGGLSVMSTDSCNANSCGGLTIALNVGYLLLFISLVYSAYSIYSDRFSLQKWTIILRPYVALPIFIIIVAIGMSVGM